MDWDSVRAKGLHTMHTQRPGKHQIVHGSTPGPGARASSSLWSAAEHLPPEAEAWLCREADGLTAIFAKSTAPQPGV